MTPTNTPPHPLPVGAVITIEKLSPYWWRGTLAAAGVTVSLVGYGHPAITNRLMRKWVEAAQSKGKQP